LLTALFTALYYTVLFPTVMVRHLIGGLEPLDLSYLAARIFKDSTRIQRNEV
jgi:hypothetical protein